MAHLFKNMSKDVGGWKADVWPAHFALTGCGQSRYIVHRGGRFHSLSYQSVVGRSA